MSLSASAVRTEAAGDASDVRAGKYLTFRLGREEFGIGVLQVREIVGRWQQPVVVKPLAGMGARNTFRIDGSLAREMVPSGVSRWAEVACLGVGT